MSLFKGNAKYLLPFQFCRTVCRINLNDIISTLPLGLEDFQCLRLIARCNDTVGNFPLDHLCSGHVANVRQSDKVTVRRHTVCTAGTSISTRQRREFTQIIYEIDLLQGIRQRCTNCGTCRRNVLERSCRTHAGCFFQFRYQLPAIESVQQIDIARLAVQYSDRQIAAVLHIDTGRLLIRITAVF